MHAIGHKVAHLELKFQVPVTVAQELQFDKKFLPCEVRALGTRLHGCLMHAHKF